MAIDGFEGKVLFVDDEQTMRGIYERSAQRIGLSDFEVLEDAPSAVTRIGSLEEAAAAIFSDGLEGGWRDVIAAAKEAKTPGLFVVSGDSRIKNEAEAMGAVFMDKGEVDIDFVGTALAGLSPNQSEGEGEEQDKGAYYDDEESMSDRYPGRSWGWSMGGPWIR